MPVDTNTAWPMYAGESRVFGSEKTLRVDLDSCESNEKRADVPTPSTAANTPSTPVVHDVMASPGSLATEPLHGAPPFPMMFNNFPTFEDLKDLPAVPPPPDLADIPASWNYNPFTAPAVPPPPDLAGIPASWNYNPFTAPAEPEPSPFPETPLEELYGGWPGSLNLLGVGGTATPTPWQRSAAVDHPMQLKLKDLRALPSRGLGLHYDEGQFGVISLPESRPPTGPAATVVREGAPAMMSRGLPEVSWSVKDWVATRKVRSSGFEDWVVTDTVQLTRTPDASPAEWERRFCQREKQVMVGKGTRGYQSYAKMIPKDQRAARPVTPRVAEQCSKRAFDGRLKQWRIMLHAFSPRGSPESTPRTSGRESTEEDWSHDTPVVSPPTTSLPTSKWQSPQGCGEQGLFGGFPSMFPPGFPEPCEDVESLNAVLQALEQLRMAAEA